MKKISIIFGLIFLQQFIISAQDLLVTVDGDTLNCKITKIKDNYLYFTFTHQNEVRNTLLPQEQVRYYQYNYYNTFSIQPNQIVGYKPEFSHWRIAVNGGWSYRLSPVANGLTPAQKDHIKKLKSGFSFNCDVTYYITEMLGIGAEYDLFKTSYSSSLGKDDISISFFGPTFSMRFFNQSKTNYWLMNYTLGYMGYKDKGENALLSGTLKGGTLGLGLGIGYDFVISKNWSAGIQLSLLAGSLSEYELIGNNGAIQTIKLEKDEYEGLARMNISVGLRCNL